MIFINSINKFYWNMLVKQLSGVLFLTALLFYYSYYQYKNSSPNSQQMYHYYIHKQHVQPYQKSSIITVSHSTSNITNQPISFQILTQNGSKKFTEINYRPSQNLQATFDQLHPTQIKHVLLKSPIPLNINSKARLLQGITTNDTFLNFCVNGLVVIFSISRNLILIGILINKLDLLMPIIIFFESFLMLAFWTNSKHLMQNFYKNIFSSKIDIFNMIRLMMNNSPDSEALSILSKYNYSSDIFFNISGEFLVTLIFFVLTLAIKALNVFSKVQTFRYINSNLRPLWNGYIFAITPRILMFIGFQTRNIFSMRFIDFLNIFLSMILLAGLIFFLIQLIIQIRKINSRVQYLEQSRLQIGIVRRLDYKRDFDFDCLHYSMLHYPSMIYIRLFVFFLPIGTSYDIHYIQFGGCIVSQLFIIMIGISCPGYTRNRDKVLYIICDFLFLVLCLCMIAIGLAESVYHSQASIIAQKILFSLAIVQLVIYIIQIIFDVIQNNCMDKQKQKGTKQKKQQQADDFIKNISKNKQKTTKFNNQINSQDKQLQSQKQNNSAATIKRNIKLRQQNVKKVRKGKII